MPNDNVLKPCPFCGGDVKHIQGLPPLDDSHFIDCPGCGVSSKIASTKEAVIEAWNRRAHPGHPEPRAEVTASRCFRCGHAAHTGSCVNVHPDLDSPSLTNPLTPYGMLVRALRIVSGTTLMDMAQHLGRGPAELSAIEFGRKPVRDADIVDAAHFFACAGIQSTTHALTIAARAGGQ